MQIFGSLEKMDKQSLVSSFHGWLMLYAVIFLIGRYKTYPAGGYAAVLGRTTYNSYFNLGYIVKTQWLDMATRMVCIEFLVYSVNYNIFNSVKLILEKTGSGYFDQAYKVL